MRWCQVIVYPRNLRFQGRSTALLSRLTFSRSRFSRNRVIDSITRSPAAFDFT